MNPSALADEISVTETSFAIEVVAKKDQLREAFRLRHQVYCVERGFENAANNEETDEFDSRARHVLLRHASDGEVLGTVRVVGPNLSNLSNSFPMQRLCSPAHLRHMPLRRTGEISRFAISKQRRMSCTGAAMLRLALLRGVVQLSSEMGLTHWFAVMERSLVRLHQSNAIHFHPIGPLVDYHGVRQPTFGAITTVLDRIAREQAQIWHFLTDGGRWFGGQQAYAQAA